MKIEIRLWIEAGDGGPCDEELLVLDKPNDRLEQVGLSLAEARELPARVQERVVGVQATRSSLTIATVTRAAGVYGARAEPRFSTVRRSATCR